VLLEYPSELVVLTVLLMWPELLCELYFP